MPRRRYRAYTVAAVVILFMLYHVAQNSWGEPSSRLVNLRQPPKTAVHPDLDTTAPQQPQQASSKSGTQIDLQKHNIEAEKPLGGDSTKHDYKKEPVPSSSSPEPKAAPAETPAPKSSAKVAVADPATETNEAAAEPATKAPPSSSAKPSAASSKSDNRIHWKSFSQHFPVPTESMAALPTGKPKSIPKIQHEFKAESAEDEKKREARLAKVKASISKSWNSYRKNAWMHDELRPISGKFRDPFCGWAATLVDSLDTLWIAGLKDEFDDAVKNGVANIDFTFSEKDDIPVFETTIRYLGGLLSAFDVSGGHKGDYPVLLDKAVELAEVLYGVFDTPNRMPVLYYRWQPKSVSQPHKASTVGVAELATLSMEFTRLAQLTKENKYYDAIDRITNALVKFQKEGQAAIPGLFPEQIDASGCDATAAHMRNRMNKKSHQGDDVECVDKGLRPGSSWSQSFSMGGSQDSAYEYFPKEYLLLGGLESKYKKLHEDTVNAVDEWLMYRPMINDTEWDIYFPAKVRTQGKPENDMTVEYEATHLTCFIGGMYGLGAKIFDRPKDLETAKRLTDGCVWAYSKTPSGLMPEASILLHCPTLEKCKFDEMKWYDALDSNGAWRDEKAAEWDLKYGTNAQSGKEGDNNIPTRPQTHKEYAQESIASSKLPAGFSSVTFRSYILRPEAIESVWYMYRITGDSTWMDKGWAMFEATMAATDTDLANSAISDVMADKPPMTDQMESFWIAETLKYYYMLYAGPDVISLDEWVLNTEAHPFRRPT